MEMKWQLFEKGVDRRDSVAYDTGELTTTMKGVEYATDIQTQPQKETQNSRFSCQDEDKSRQENNQCKKTQGQKETCSLILGYFQRNQSEKATAISSCL
jgi:hypothetical protein